MHPEEAVRQVQCVINASLDEDGNRTAPMYKPTFKRVASEGCGSDVTVLADKLCAEVRDGARPLPEDVDLLAEQILDGQQTYTDGGSS